MVRNILHLALLGVAVFVLTANDKMLSKIMIIQKNVATDEEKRTLGSDNHVIRGIQDTAGGTHRSHSFPTSRSSWSAERVASYEREITPEDDPKRTRNLLYADRNREQFVAELENGHELVRYLSNTATLPKPIYNLLIRVVVWRTDRRKSCQERWDALLEGFQLPSMIQVRVEFVDNDNSKKGNDLIDRRFRPPRESTDWVLVVHDATYVNLKRIVYRLFAEIDPTVAVGKGLLHSVDGSNVPMGDAGILFTTKALKEIWNDPPTKACSGPAVTSTDEWTVCLAKNSFVWSSLPGLNPYNPREIVQYALDGSLFADRNSTYQSVGGAIMGSARLPVTYGNMTDDDIFYHQLAVDTNQGKVPKILHQIWSGPLENIRPEVQEAAKGCQAMHEKLGWEYMFWDDEKLQALTGLPHLPELLADRKLVRFYTDVVRLYILHHFGGVYLDIDSFCLRTFDPLLNYLEEEHKDFLANYESERMRSRQIANGIMIAAPASPFLSANALHVGIKFATMKKRGSDFKVTGPWATTETRDQWESWAKPHQITLSSSAFIPLYKDEGDGLDLEDVFSIATRQGSYTVQMYQGTKNRNMFQLIKEANANNKPNNRKEASLSNLSDTEQPSTLMIVAHPDDEVLWGGDYLIEKGSKAHVVVTCTQSSESPTRFHEFQAVQEHLGFRGEFLDGKDRASSKPLEGHIQDRIGSLICENRWKRIVTHGPEGEYGHPQHQVVHDTVLAAVRLCHQSYDKLFVFEPQPSENYSFPAAKVDLARHYQSQKKVIFETFADWKERIVPFGKYNHRKASDTCQKAAAGAKSAKYRHCRLHEVLNLSAAASNDELALEWDRWAADNAVASSK